MPSSPSAVPPLRVLVAGGGVAGLEVVLGLHAEAGERAAITLLAPEPDFVYRPLSVATPFTLRAPRRYPLARVAADTGAELRASTLERVDPDARRAYAADGAELAYDELVVAVGARAAAPYRHAMTFFGAGDVERVRGLLADVEEGYTRRLAFVVPPGAVWALPLYELALQTAERAREMGIAEVRLTLVTPEPAPLALFGPAASTEVGRLLRAGGIDLRTGVYAAIDRPGELRLRPGGEVLECDRVLTLPEPHGPGVAGLPGDERGFVPVDWLGRVTGVEHVFAAGDATTFPVKQGGIACQQADVVARVLAAQATGGRQVPEPFRPVLRGLLLTGDGPRYLRHEAAGGRGPFAETATHALWWPPVKVAGRYLAPYLGELDEEAALRLVHEAHHPIELELEGAGGHGLELLEHEGRRPARR